MDLGKKINVNVENNLCIYRTLPDSNWVVFLYYFDFTGALRS